MKLALLSSLAFVAAALASPTTSLNPVPTSYPEDGLAPHENIIISWPKETSHELIEGAKKMIEDAGGVITKEFTIMKGIAASVPAETRELFDSIKNGFLGKIEPDQKVTINKVSNDALQ
ncbi:unnamed protein product [Diplocarpon coronariae]|uniref:Inhibitor I9 domain-containing protein n=1 Tax=Diplocarpon coronariae TaxID=2795749 RepID=A0A218YZ01_9HELO|nr:hypothetical protein JHW43_001927 [Diplocarpon mali]OWP00878.1 hypothetical protein B2J93_2571 [Marssonina coronariae]